MIIIFIGFIMKLLIVISQIFFELPLTQTDPAAFHSEAVNFAAHLKNNFLNRYIVKDKNGINPLI